jgi:hypothetical protein
MLKCGQKGNTKYIFGLRKEQIEVIEKEAMIMIYCPQCNKPCKKDSSYCQHCGAKL